MQLTKKNICGKAMAGMMALIWIAGLLIAGSESPYMPWMNLVGVVIFFEASLWLGRVLSMLEIQKDVVSTPKSVMTQGSIKLVSEKRNFKVNTRFAGRLSVV